jgi:hypothetical protein
MLEFETIRWVASHLFFTILGVFLIAYTSWLSHRQWFIERLPRALWGFASSPFLRLVSLAFGIYFVLFNIFWLSPSTIVSENNSVLARQKSAAISEDLNQPAGQTGSAVATAEEPEKTRAQEKEELLSSGNWALGTWLCSKSDETLSVEIVPPGQEGSWSTTLKIPSMSINSADSGTQKITSLKSESKVRNVVDEYGRPNGTETSYILTVTAQNKKAGMFNRFWLVPTGDDSATFRVRKNDDVESYRCKKE